MGFLAIMNMSIKNGFLFLLSLLKNPNLYVAAVVGSVPGGITGGQLVLYLVLLLPLSLDCLPDIKIYSLALM